MSSTMLLSTNNKPSTQLDKQFLTILASLNIASALASALTVALAVWSRFWRCNAQHVDGLRCRAVMAMGISTACFSVSQLSLMSDSTNKASSISVRISVFIATFSIVMNSLLVVCSIGMDAAVRYGLRSFGLARRLSDYYEIVCFTISLIVSQPILYLFSSVSWTESAVLVEAKSRAAFDAAQWMIESIWTLLAMILAVLFIGYALIKARKIARYTGRFTNASMESVLGTTASIRGRVYVSLCYVAVFVGLAIWRLLFRITGSKSIWLLQTASICDSLNAEFTLVVFVIDLFVNINRKPVWLGSSPSLYSSRSCSVETISHKTGHMLAECQLSSSKFGNVDEAMALKWQNIAGATTGGKLMSSTSSSAKAYYPTSKDIGSWQEEINRCYLQSSISHSENDGYSVSDISFESRPPERHGEPTVILHPLTN